MVKYINVKSNVKLIFIYHEKTHNLLKVIVKIHEKKKIKFGATQKG